MTNCEAYIDLPGSGRYYCTLTKRQHRGYHEARDSRGNVHVSWADENSIANKPIMRIVGIKKFKR